ncbi:hypothetical protein V1264_011791 [Littorina saxatilis]|uniref:Uncharacterized protein n=1 Tax=Littorina saxatilis TaxID=31220 RepID=A0AAN9BVY4_9CAEN
MDSRPLPKPKQGTSSEDAVREGYLIVDAEASLDTHNLSRKKAWIPDHCQHKRSLQKKRFMKVIHTHQCWRPV